MKAILKKLGLLKSGSSSSSPKDAKKADETLTPLDDTKSSELSPSEDDDSYEEDESLDSVRELPSLEANYMMRKQRHSVSAEAYGEWNVKGLFTAPVHPKTAEQTARIRDALAKGFIFNCLDRKDLITVIDAFVEKKVAVGETIIQQGDDGDCLYLIEAGEFDVFKLLAGDEEPRHMCVMGVGDAVGELALLYNCPRAATVTAKTEAVLWELDRESFNHIVKDAASRKRETHESFLAEVELLKDMDPYERSKLADALRSTHHKPDEFIIKEGDSGDTFYIIESGSAVALKMGQVVLEYKRGEYFGELALIRDQPRAASVQAKTELECVSLDRRSFKRLLGPVDEILRRNAERYKKVKAQLTCPNLSALASGPVNLSELAAQTDAADSSGTKQPIKEE